MTMQLNVDAQIRIMMKMSMTDLKTRYADLFGEVTKSNNRIYLVRRIAWRLQVQAEGDLSERARRRADELASEADLRVRAPDTPRTPAPRTRNPRNAAPVAARGDIGEPVEGVARNLARQPAPHLVGSLRNGRSAGLPAPGTLLSRRYKGELIIVKVLARGFEYEGEVYRSLTAIAEKVTGSHWNGNRFFNIGNAAKRASKEVA